MFFGVIRFFEKMRQIYQLISFIFKVDDTFLH